MKYSDETLVGYLNGTLSASMSDQIEADIAVDEKLERHLMSLDKVALSVADAFKPLPGKEREARLAKEIGRDASRGFYWQSAVAATALLLIGVALWFQFGGQQQDWRVAVAQYQAFYVPETLATLDQNPDRLTKELAHASDAIGLSLSLQDISDIAGLTLKRVQVLGFEGKPLIQMVYANQDGMPIAFCFMEHDDMKSGEASLNGLSSYSWGTKKHQFIVVGAVPQADLTRLGKLLRQRVRTKVS